jgi:hypothetical protein
MANKKDNAINTTANKAPLFFLNLLPKTLFD